MRRLELVEYGPLPDAVRFADAPLPAIADHEVRVRVHAAALNPIDYKVIHGALRGVMPLKLPAALGFDCSGHIDSVGARVGDFAAGDPVYVRAPRQHMGSLAEYLVVEARFVARAPERLTLADAASIPLVALTTVQGLVDRAAAQRGQRILIHAGSGGLGSFAVQYAKHELGLHVTTTTSRRNADWVGRLGADVVIAYDEQDYQTLPDRYDIVFDTLGGATTADSFKVLRRGGAVVSVAGPPDWSFARQVGAGVPMAAAMWAKGLPMELRARLQGGRYFRYLTESDGAQLTHIAEVIDAGKLRAIVDRVFSFDQSVEALQYLEAGRAKGKVVVRVEGQAAA
jgi:NADPH:quinone reductase-like Zn-dependent oxidoreductase